MKVIVCILAFCFYTINSFCQVNYYKLSAGIEAGLTRSATDVNTPKLKQVFIGTADYHFTPFITAGIEFQKGKLYGSDSRTPYPFFHNSYSTFILGGKLHLGQFTSAGFGRYDEGLLTNFVNGLYLSSGAGMIFNNQKEILRSIINDSGTTTTFYGVDKNKEFLIPASIGVDYNLGTTLIINANYKQHYTLGDNLDGYLVPESRNDWYSTFTIGIKYKFGSKGVY